MPWIERGLDAARLAVMFGLTLVLGGGAVSVLELGRCVALLMEVQRRFTVNVGLRSCGTKPVSTSLALLLVSTRPDVVAGRCRFGCSTGVQPNGSMESVAWEYSTAAMVSLLTLSLYCIHCLPGVGSRKRERLLLEAACVVLPTIWTPVMITVVATADCPDTALLHPQSSAEPTLPAGGRGTRANESIVDEVGRVVAVGVLLIGLGSTLMVLYLVSEPILTAAGLLHRHSSRFPAKTRAITLTAILMVYFFGSVFAFRSAQDWDTQTRTWARNASNAARAEALCTGGPTAVFGRALAAADPEGLANLITAMFSFVLTAVIVGVIGGLGAIAETFPPEWINLAAVLVTGFFWVSHLLVTFVLTQLVAIGANPLCTRATLAGDQPGTDGVCALAYGFVTLAVLAVTAIPTRFPKAHRKSAASAVDSAVFSVAVSPALAAPPKLTADASTATPASKPKSEITESPVEKRKDALAMLASMKQPNNIAVRRGWEGGASESRPQATHPGGDSPSAKELVPPETNPKTERGRVDEAGAQGTAQVFQQAFRRFSVLEASGKGEAAPPLRRTLSATDPDALTGETHV